MKRILLLFLTLFSFTRLYCQEKITTVQPENDTIYTMVDKAPEFLSGDIYAWLGQHIVYPKSAIERGIEGTVFVSFVVEKNGTVSNITLLKGVDSSLNREALWVISKMPGWSAGNLKGNDVRVKLMLPVKFKLVENIDTNKIYTTAEHPPQFDGDYEVWVAENIQYDKKKQGIVYLDVIIERDGRISNAKILRNAAVADSEKMGKEALRLVKIMPKWTPAYQDSKPIRFEAAISVKFNIMDINTYTKVNKIYCDTCVQIPPKFSTDLFGYFQKNIARSQNALDNNAQGNVTVTYIIEKDGSLSDIHVVWSDPGAELLEPDAVRVVREMTDFNKWTPGYQHGKPVRVREYETIRYNMGPDNALYKVYNFDK